MLKGKSQKELIQLSKQLVQPLFPHFHKGQAGRVAVIGGSEDYTGAPFFSSHAGALVGSDMNHLICEKLAAPVIKSYSPDLMVHPYLYQLTNPDIKAILNDEEIKQLLELTSDEVVNQKQPKLNTLVDEYVMPKVTPLLNRIDIVVIGPGFGRDPLMVRSLIRIVQEIKVLNKQIIMDADSLFTLSLNPSLIDQYSKAIITPNVVEFDRIAKRLKVENSIEERNLENVVKSTTELSKALGGVFVFRKGESDIIAKGDSYLVNNTLGSPKRVGGQGDTLSGSIATLVNWSNNYDKGLWEPDQKKLEPDESTLLACFAASTLVRTSSYKAYEKYGRAMQTSNIHSFLGDTYNEMYGEGDFVKL